MLTLFKADSWEAQCVTVGASGVVKANRETGVLGWAGGNRLSHCHQQVLIKPAD